MNPALAAQGIASMHIQCFLTDHNFRKFLLQTTRTKICFKHATELFKYLAEFLKHLAKISEALRKNQRLGQVLQNLASVFILQHSPWWPKQLQSPSSPLSFSPSSHSEKMRWERGWVTVGVTFYFIVSAKSFSQKNINRKKDWIRFSGYWPRISQKSWIHSTK